MNAPRSPWIPEAPDTANVVPDPAPVPADQPKLADVALLIERTDLGPGAATLVRAGDPVPNWLASLPRKPADGKPGKLKGGRR
jgi:hypothetical protein